MHGIGAVADDDAVGAARYLLFDRLCHRDPVLGGDVFTEHTEQLPGLEIAIVGQLRYCAVQLSWRKGGDDGAGAVVEAAGDGAARPEKDYRVLGRVNGELLLFDAVLRFVVAMCGYGLDSVRP